MTDFLAGLVARARDGAPALERRRPSLFESPVQPAPAGAPELAQLWAFGPQGPGEEGDGALEETATVEAPRRALLSTGTPVPARARSGSRAVPRTGSAEPSPSSPGDKMTADVEQAGADSAPQMQGRRTARSPSADTAELPAPTTLPAPNQAPVSRDPRIRSIETIVEVPASARPATPVLPQPSKPSAEETGPGWAAAAAPSSRDHDHPLLPAELPRPWPGQPGHAPRAASGELGAIAPVRPQGHSAGRRDLPAAAPPPAPPAIQVTIGRIEVRATPARTPAALQAPRPSGPKLGLDEYLRSRSGRGG